MKVRDTSRGRMYAVSSEIGCTAINGAMAVDIPVGGQSVILALDKKIVIDGDDTAKFVEVRWGTNTAVGSRPVPAWLSDVLAGLVSIVGEANFDINYIPAENKLYLQFSLEVTTEQIEEVRSLLDRVLPRNLVTEMYWADGFPVNYTRLEYLESTGTQWIRTDFVPNDESGVMARYINNSGNAVHPIVTTETVDGVKRGFSVATIRNVSSTTCVWGYQRDPANHGASPTAIVEGQTNYLNSRTVIWYNRETNYYLKRYIKTDAVYPDYVSPLPYTPTVPFHFCKDLWYGGNVNFRGKLLEAKFSQGEQDACIFVPALDDTGTPCMFDLVARTPFYNSGTGDFTYPGKETEATTYSLRNRMYAQLTEHGIRRLYRVPEGYNGTKEEYAEKHGFKILVETPQPEEGYWTPVWHDREDCIELEWVETEAPMEETLQIEDTENA